MKLVDSYSVSAQALQPLKDAFWSPTGWRIPPVMPGPAEMATAVQNGVMFNEPVELGHDAWITRARTAVSAVSLPEVTDAFIASLPTRRLDLRSALASFAFARHLPAHSFEPDPYGRRCRVCGLYEAGLPEDLNVLSFERFKWGGVRRDSIVYTTFDLEQFRRAPREAPTGQAMDVGCQLLTALHHAAPAATSTTIVRDISMVKGNAQERRVLVDILGIVGVLATNDHPGYQSRFIAYADRALPNRHFVESAYPACWWRGADGVDEWAIREFLSPLA